MYVNYDFDKTTQDTNISGGNVGFMLPPSVRNNFIGIERIKRRPMPQVNVKNLDKAYIKKMKDLENYYKLEVEYLPIEKRPTLAELGKKGKDLYDLYNKVSKNAKNKGDITRPQKKEPKTLKEPKNTDDDMETFVIPEGAKPPTLDGVWKGMDNIPMGIPYNDEEKYETEDYDEKDVNPPKPPVFKKDELYDKGQDLNVWIKERMKLIETREADEAEYSDDWDEMEKEIIEDNFAPKDKEDIDPLDEQVYEIPENPFESMEQMDAPERELMRDD